MDSTALPGHKIPISKAIKHPSLITISQSQSLRRTRHLSSHDANLNVHMYTASGSVTKDIRGTEMIVAELKPWSSRAWWSMALALALRRAASLRGWARRGRHPIPAAPFCTDGDGFQSSRFKIFDRDFKRKQRDRAAWLMNSSDEFLDSVADNLLDRLQVFLFTFSLDCCDLGDYMFT